MAAAGRTRGSVHSIFLIFFSVFKLKPLQVRVTKLQCVPADHDPSPSLTFSESEPGRRHYQPGRPGPGIIIIMMIMIISDDSPAGKFPPRLLSD